MSCIIIILSHCILGALKEYKKLVKGYIFYYVIEKKLVKGNINIPV